MKLPNPLEEALKLTTGPRRDAYGHPSINFSRIAAGWSVITETEITPEMVAMCMIWTKICREINTPDPDNLTDMAGYINTLDMLKNDR